MIAHRTCNIRTTRRMQSRSVSSQPPRSCADMSLAQAPHSAPHAPMPATIAPPQPHMAPYSAMDDLGDLAVPDNYPGYNAASYVGPFGTIDTQYHNPPPSINTAPFALAPMLPQHARTPLRTSRQGTPPPEGRTSLRSNIHQAMGPPPSLPERGSMGGNAASIAKPRSKAPRDRTSSTPYPTGERRQRPTPAQPTPAQTTPARVGAAAQRRIDHMIALANDNFVNSFATAMARPTHSQIQPLGSGPPVASQSALPYTPAASGPPVASGSRSRSGVTPVASVSGLPYTPAAHAPTASGPPTASGSALSYPRVASNTMDTARWGQSGRYEDLMSMSNRYQHNDTYGHQQFMPPRSPPPQ